MTTIDRRAPRRRHRALTVLAAALLALGLLAPARPAEAAGVTTHAWMAEVAIDHLESEDLRLLLEANFDQVVAGAMFPDAGYIPGYDWGEEAHWQRFVDRYADQLAARDDCGDLTAPTGPCAPMIAHLMGVQAHGIGDEVWDWLFEPYSPDLDEYYLHDDFGPFSSDGGQELTMDIVAVGRYGRERPTVPPIPSTDALVAAFEESGHGGTTPADFALHVYGEIVWDAVNSWIPNHLEPLQEEMPWMSANLIDAPGGVTFGAMAIAGAWESQWARILDDPVPTEVSATYPADGQRAVPASGWLRSYQPGSNPGRGGAATRIAASLTYALPYRDAPGGAPVSNQLPAGAMVISERDTGTVLPNLSGFPRAVPYGADSGERMIGAQPGVDLDACTWYRVETTEALLDAEALPVTPTAWEFRTGLDARGTPCPDDPIDADDRHLAGLVTRTDGTPVDGVKVRAYRAIDGIMPTAFTTTDERGTYAFADLPAGEYRIAFTPPADTGLSASWSGGAPNRASATPIDHVGATWGIDQLLVGGATLTGSLTDHTGSPLPDARIQAFRAGVSWVPEATVTTGSDGDFDISGLAPGPLWLRIVPPAGSGLTARWVGGHGQRPVEPSTVTTLDQATTLNLSLTATPGISGSVVGPDGTAVADARVILFHENDTWMGRHEVRTGHDGSFALGGVSDGTYLLRIVAPEATGLPATWHGGPTRGEATEFVLEGDTVITGVEVQLGT